MPYERSAAVYDVIYGDKAYVAEAEALRDMIARLHPKANTLLEVGCGTGGHLCSLREHYACSGLDLSEAMLARARLKLPGVSLHCADMRTFELPDRFDVIASVFSCIGYVRSVSELDAAIARMAHHLAAGGVLLVEPWFTPAQWKPKMKIHCEARLGDEASKIVRMCVSGQRGRFAIAPMHHLVATLDGVEHFCETHELFLAEMSEMRAAFEAAGLQGVRYEPGVLVRGLWIGHRR